MANIYARPGVNLLIRITCLFWIAAKIICWKLWLAGRLLPLAPVFNWYVPSVIHLVLLIISLLLLPVLFFYPTSKKIQIAVIITEVLSCLLDQNRWQPWEYQYIFTFFICIINKENEKNIYALWGFMVAAIYIYSGLGKMNPVFLYSAWYRFFLVHLIRINPATAFNPVIFHAGYFLGVLEILFGIGLFFKRTTKLSALLLIIMHVLIIITFGPFGENYDSIIWPWNIIMIIYLWLMIYRNPEFNIAFSSLLKRWNIPVVMAFGIMPALNFFGYWDFFLSSSLFSYKPPDMYICINKTEAAKQYVDYSVANKLVPQCDSNSLIIDVRKWSFKEMHAPANPELRVYKIIAGDFAKHNPGLNPVFIIYYYNHGKKVSKEIK